MKKLTAILLALVLVLSLAACGAEENPNEDLVITRAPEAEGTEAPAEGGEEAPAADEGMFTFQFEGVELIPGAAFDPAALRDATSVYEVPSCAIEGTDNVYNYDTFEITAYDDGTGEVIYSIYFLDSSLTTTEGLALGDDEAKVTELYGEDYEVDGTAYVYTRTDSQLFVIVENGSVVSIEYRMVVA